MMPPRPLNSGLLAGDPLAAKAREIPQSANMAEVTGAMKQQPQSKDEAQDKKEEK